MLRRLRWLRLSAACLTAECRVRYARQMSIGEGWAKGRPQNHGGWDLPGQFDGPTFVSAIPHGDICVSDSRNHRVHIIPTPNVNPEHPAQLPVYRTFGRFGFGPGELYRPAGCAGDGSVLFVVDTYNHRLQKYNVTDGRLLSRNGWYGSGPGELNFPHGVSIADGMLYVADQRNHRIVTFDTQLRYVFTFGKRGTGPGELSHPLGVAVQGSTIFVADSGNDRIQVFTTRGKFLRSLGQYGEKEGDLNLPSDVSLAHGRVYVSELGGKRVQVLTPFGQPVQILRLLNVGSLSSVDADMAHERVYVADFDLHRVHVMAIRGANDSTGLDVSRQTKSRGGKRAKAESTGKHKAKSQPA